MAVTEQDLSEFNQYAQERISNGVADSMSELFQDWLNSRDVDAAINEGIADINAGRTRPFSESQDEFRRERGLPTRK